MHKPMSLTSVERFLDAATDAGVQATTLNPITAVAERGEAFREVMATYDKLDPVGDAIANGGDLTAALKAEAENEAIYARAEAHADYIQSGASHLVGNLMADPAVADPILADLAAAMKPATAAINKVSDRWGTETPDPGRVINESTATELKEFKDVAKHIATRDKIRNFVSAYLVEAPGVGHSVGGFKYPILRVPTGLRSAHRWRWMWIIRDDGTFFTTQQARAHLNAHRTYDEQSTHGERRQTPRATFLANYSVHPDALDTATFTPDGKPVDGTPMMTDDDYMILFGGGGDNAAAHAYRDKLEAIRSSR